MSFCMREILENSGNDGYRKQVEALIYLQPRIPEFQRFYELFFIQRYRVEDQRHCLAFSSKGSDLLPITSEQVVQVNSAPTLRQNNKSSKDSPAPVKSSVQEPKKSAVMNVPLILLSPKLNVLQIFHAFLQGDALSSDLYHYLRRFASHHYLMPAYCETK